MGGRERVSKILFFFSPNPTHSVHFVGVQLFICRGWWALLLYAKRVRCFIALESKSLFHGTKMKSVAPFFRLPWWAKSVESLTSGVNPGINPHTMFDQAFLFEYSSRSWLIESHVSWSLARFGWCTSGWDAWLWSRMSRLELVSDNIRCQRLVWFIIRSLHFYFCHWNSEKFLLLFIYKISKLRIEIFDSKISKINCPFCIYWSLHIFNIFFAVLIK